MSPVSAHSWIAHRLEIDEQELLGTSKFVDVMLTIEDVEGEEIEFFFCDFTKAFKIRDSEIECWNSYMKYLWRERGFHISDLTRWLFRTPQLEVEDLTIRDMCDAAKSGKWPETMLVLST